MLVNYSLVGLAQVLAQVVKELLGYARRMLQSTLSRWDMNRNVFVFGSKSFVYRPSRRSSDNNNRETSAVDWSWELGFKLNRCQSLRGQCRLPFMIVHVLHTEVEHVAVRKRISDYPFLFDEPEILATLKAQTCLLVKHYSL